MRTFRIGYILTLSFLLLFCVAAFSFGFFPPPEGPKAPKYPTYSGSSSIPSLGEKSDFSSLDNRYDDYERQRKAYEEDQKIFVKEKVIPYVRNMFVGWLIILGLFQIVAILMVKFISELVGAAYTFSGVWAAIVGPFGTMMWFLNSLVSSFARSSEQEFSVDPIFQALALTSFLGVIILTAMGIFFFRNTKNELFSASPAYQPIPPAVPPASPPPPPVAPPQYPPEPMAQQPQSPNPFPQTQPL